MKRAGPPTAGASSGNVYDKDFFLLPFIRQLILLLTQTRNRLLLEGFTPGMHVYMLHVKLKLATSASLLAVRYTHVSGVST